MNKYLLIFLMMASANAYPALIKWLDADGQVHYSDVPPPPNTNTKILRTITKSADAKNEIGATAASAPAPDAAKTIAERDVELKKAQQAKKEAADKAAKQQAEAEAKKTYCTSLKQSIRDLQEGGRIRGEDDASGNRTFLDDEQRQQRIAKAQQDFSANCK